MRMVKENRNSAPMAIASTEGTNIAGLAVVGSKVAIKLTPVAAKSIKAGLVLASFGAYASLFTWRFAVFIIVTLFIHELGHVWAMRRCGLGVKGIYFLPIVGAATVATGKFPSRTVEAYVALWGPIFGLGASVLAALVYFAFRDPVWAAAAGWSALFNLFNLLPLYPLDGGRVMVAIYFSSRNIHVVTLVGILANVVFCLGGLLMGMGLFAILGLVVILEFHGTALNGCKSSERVRKREIEEAERKWTDTANFRDEKRYRKLAARFDRYIARNAVPFLSGRGLIVVSAAYAILIFSLWSVAAAMNSEPGVKVAMEMLKG